MSVTASTSLCVSREALALKEFMITGSEPGFSPEKSEHAEKGQIMAKLTGAFKYALCHYRATR